MVNFAKVRVDWARQQFRFFIGHAIFAGSSFLALALVLPLALATFAFEGYGDLIGWTSFVFIRSFSLIICMFAWRQVRGTFAVTCIIIRLSVHGGHFKHHPKIFDLHADKLVSET